MTDNQFKKLAELFYKEFNIKFGNKLCGQIEEIFKSESTQPTKDEVEETRQLNTSNCSGTMEMGISAIQICEECGGTVGKAFTDKDMIEAWKAGYLFLFSKERRGASQYKDEFHWLADYKRNN